MVVRKSSVSSSPQVLQTLAWMRKQNFKPVPLHVRSKAAINRNYADAAYEPPGDDFWSSGAYGIGIKTGPASGGPIDIDLDCPEAVSFAAKFLPATPAVFGRKSKPSSHYLYRVSLSTLAKLALTDPVYVDNKTIIEIRADGGHQTVMPGSLHEATGELIEWSGVPFPDVPMVEYEVLRKAVMKIGVLTLIVRHIWLDGQRNEAVKHLAGMFYYLKWTEEEVIELVEAADEWCNSFDKTHKMTVSSTFRKGDKGSKVTGAPALKKMLQDDRVVDRILDWAGSPMVNLLMEYNSRWAAVSIEGKFKIADTEVQPGEPPIFFNKDDFLNVMGTDWITTEDKPILKGRVWLTNPQRRSYRNIEFMPGADDTGNTLNLWTGWALKPVKGSCDAWLELLRDVICGGDQELYNWMLHWFANIVREPRAKAMTCPVLIGVQGAGKSLLVGYFGKILGPAYTVVTNEEHIHGKFNKHLSTTLLMHSEEALYGGDKKHRGIIKSLITDDFRIFEQKGIDARQVRNYLRLILTSNEDHAAPAEAGDRRFTVIDLKGRKVPEELYRRVLAEMNGGGPEALFDFLLNMEYDSAVPRINIKNAALGDLKKTNFTPLEAWWLETLSSGFVLPEYLAWATIPTREAWPAVVASPALYMSLLIRMRERNQRPMPNETAVSLALNKLLGTTLRRQQRQFANPLEDGGPPEVLRLGDRMSAIINMPTLDECRKAFCTYLGQDIEWPDEGPAAPKEKF